MDVWKGQPHSGKASIRKEVQQSMPHEEPQPYSFPLDRFLTNTLADANTHLNQLRIGDVQHGNIKRKVNELTAETEKITEGFVPEESAPESKKSSSTSLNDSESGYTERLVEAKFKEVTFKKSAKTNASRTQDIGRHETLRKPVNYSPKLYEEKKITDVPTPCSDIKENTAFPFRVSGQHYHKSTLKPKSVENAGTLISKSSSSTVKPCKCGKNPPTLSKKYEENLPMRKNPQSIDCNVKESLKQPNYQPIYTASSVQRTCQDVSVNTERPFIHNTSLINVTSAGNDVQNKSLRKSYQVQEMPIVNIRPNLTKQTGPIIDIKVSKPCFKKNNVAVVEYVHPEVLQETKFKRHCDIINKHKHNLEKCQKVSSGPSSYKANKELKLQRSLKEMLRKLNEKGPNVDRLKNSVNSLLLLLNKIVPLHTAAIRYQNDNISLIDESIDLFFTNMDIVQEVIENELKNSDELFCKHPEYLIKAINLLCGNIKSIFDVSGSQPCVKPSINDYIERRKFEPKSSVRNIKEDNKKSVLQTSKSIRSPLTSSTSESISNKESTMPKSIYIPFKKLIPGGMYKKMEDAEAQSEIELRRKRLEKIHEINSKLKKELTTNNNSDLELTKNNYNQAVDHNQDMLNRTFVIESGNEEDINELAQQLYKTGNEISKKSDADYEEDWEEEILSSVSSSDKAGSLKMESIVVEAQIHHTEGNPNSGNDTEPLSGLPDAPSKEINTISEDEQVFRKDVTNKNNVISVAIQTEEKIVVPVRQNSEMEATIKNNKHDAPEAKNNYQKQQDISSCPVLRMTNPITNSLVEVRFPEQSERFQSSVHFQKSESREEIKLFYNMNQEKISKNKDESVIEEDSDKNDNISFIREAKKTDKSEQTKECTNDFENITLGFIGFLENKVTEMVNKFKSSESISETLLSEKLALKQNIKLSRTTSHNTGLERLKPNISIYKSNSSLFSDKSTEELKFCKNVVSRGCSPEIGRLKFENLVSPPLVLQMKKDAPSQTDNNVPRLTDACIGTGESLLDSSSPGLLELSEVPNDQSSCNKNQKEQKKLKEVVQYDLLTADQGLRWSNPSDVEGSKTISQQRLLPLPEDVLSEGKSNYNKSNLNLLETLNLLITPVKINEQQKEEKYKGERNQQEDILKNNKESNSNLLFNNSLKRMNGPEEVPAIAFSKIDEGGDSQRTSQIYNFISMTDSNKVLNEHSLASSQDLTIKGKENLDDTKEKNKINNNYETKNVITPIKSQSEDDDQSLIMSKQYSERAHLMVISGGANPDLELTSKYNIDNESLVSPSFDEINPNFGTLEMNSLEVEVNKSNDQFVCQAECHKNAKEFVGESSSKCNNQIILMEAEIEEGNLADLSNLENNSTISKDGSNTLEAEEIPTIASSEGKHEIKEGVASSDYSKEVFDDEISLHSGSTTSLSEDHITIYYYNSDMSEGEIGFVYTSNSYSSGEIKPLNKIKKVENLPEKLNEIIEPGMTPSPLDKPGPSHLPKNNIENNQSENNNIGTYESSSSESISTEELQKLLAFEDKLDEETMKSLIDNNFLYSSKSSPDSQAMPHLTEAKKYC